MGISMYLAAKHEVRYMEISMYLAAKHEVRYTEISMYHKLNIRQEFPCTLPYVQLKVHGNFLGPCS